MNGYYNQILYKILKQKSIFKKGESIKNQILKIQFQKFYLSVAQLQEIVLKLLQNKNNHKELN